MSINKEYIKKKIVEAINQMPFNVEIYREKLTLRNEHEGYELITRLTGLLYSENNKENDSKLKDSGEDKIIEKKFFLVDNNINSVKVRKGDYILYNGTTWRVVSLGENLDIYFQMQVIEDEWIKY